MTLLDDLADIDPALRQKLEQADEAGRARDDKMRVAVGSQDEGYAAAILALAALAPADYQRRRKAAAKELQVTCAFLDATIRAVRQAGGEEQAKTHQREQLIAIAMKHGEFWHDDAETGFSSVTYEGVVEHHAVKGTSFRRWLIRAYGDANMIETEHGPHPAAPGSQALTEALAALDALAGRGLLDQPALRIGGAMNTQSGVTERDKDEASLASSASCARVYLDLGDASHRAIEIDQGSWRIVAVAPVRFLRCPGMMALPIPVRGKGALEALKKLIGQKGDTWILLLGWLFGCFAPRGPYPVLAITGEQGSGKTTLARLVRRLVDPNKVDLGTKPKDERDLSIAARNSWVLGFDNMSSIETDLSDAMCRLATGGGFRTRQLFTDDGEVLFSASRPQLLNAIPDVARAPDLLDRAIVIELAARPDHARSFEADLWRQFEAIAPAVLAAILDAVAGALKRLEETVLPTKPRMADFARWVEAAAPELGFKPGQFLQAYETNRQNAARMALDGDVLVPPLRALLEREGGSFVGPASDLLRRLNESVDLDIKRSKGWPGAPHALTSRLKRLAPALRRDGIEFRPDRDMHSRRIMLFNRRSTQPQPNGAMSKEMTPHDADDTLRHPLSDRPAYAFAGEL